MKHFFINMDWNTDDEEVVVNIQTEEYTRHFLYNKVSNLSELQTIIANYVAEVYKEIKKQEGEE